MEVGWAKRRKEVGERNHERDSKRGDRQDSMERTRPRSNNMEREKAATTTNSKPNGAQEQEDRGGQQQRNSLHSRGVAVGNSNGDEHHRQGDLTNKRKNLDREMDTEEVEEPPAKH